MRIRLPLVVFTKRSCGLFLFNLHALVVLVITLSLLVVHFEHSYITTFEHNYVYVSLTLRINVFSY